MQVRIMLDSMAYTENYRSYNVFVAIQLNHYWINHSKRYTKKQKYINNSETFWIQEKGVCDSSVGCQGNISICFLINLNGDSIRPILNGNSVSKNSG